MTASALVPEFPREVSIHRLQGLPRQFDLVANPEERAALARRFDLESLGQLMASLSVWRVGDEVRAKGRLLADVVQTCVISGAPVPAHVESRVDLLFSQEAEAQHEIEMEMEMEMPDCMEIRGGAIDLGEAVAQSLSLALPPYPHADDATLKEARRLLLSEEEDARRRATEQVDESPFAALQRQKQR